MAFILRIWLLGYLAMLVCVEAKDLGVRGQLFLIAEDDLLECLKKKTESLSREELETVQKKLQQHYIACFQSPQGSQELKEAKTYRQHYFDPSICLDQEIRDHQGKVMIPKGKCINPLESMYQLDDLLFFDGSDARQIEWAKTHRQQTKWILTKGKPVELEKQEQRPVYFDQASALVKKFGIQHVPARVSREGIKLKIEEIPLRG